MTFQEIADQDGVTDGAVQQSVAAHAARHGLAMPTPATPLVTGNRLAAILGVSPDKVGRWKHKGIIPSQQRGRMERFDVEDVRAALAAWAARPQLVRDTRRCYLCERDLPLDRFLTITQRQKRGDRVYTYTGPSFDCRECRNEAKRQGRRQSAEKAGRPYEARGDRAAWEAAARQRQAERKAQRQRAYQARLDEQETQRQRVRQHRRESPELECSGCHMTKPRNDFMPSALTGPAAPECRSCLCAAASATHRAQSERLADPYIKRLIANKSGLRHGQIPQALVEAKRVQVMIERALPRPPRVPRAAERRATPSGPVRYAAWLIGILAAGPIDARHLNTLARSEGFRPDAEWQAKARRRVAVYDKQHNQWSKR